MSSVTIPAVSKNSILFQKGKFLFQIGEFGIIFGPKNIPIRLLIGI